MHVLITKICNIFLDIFFPKRCVGCGDYGVTVCDGCVKEIGQIRTATCQHCGKISKNSQYCVACRKKLGTSLSGIIVAANYDEGPLKELIHHLKYSGFTEVVPLLATLISVRIKDFPFLNRSVIVPVPLHQKKHNQRGFNQAELIARDVSKNLGIHGGNALERIRNTSTQVGLTREQRMSNLKGAFRCSDIELVLGKTVLLIDDVTTSGSTLNECATELLKSGAKQVWGVVVAKRI